MTVPAVSCKALATQNSSEWPCSMCPIPPDSGLWGWGHPTYIFLIFSGHPESWTPSQIPSWCPPLGCTLLHCHSQESNTPYASWRHVNMGSAHFPSTLRPIKSIIRFIIKVFHCQWIFFIHEIMSLNKEHTSISLTYVNKQYVLC